MKRIIFVCSILLLSICCNAKETLGFEDRKYWIETMIKIADPVLLNMSKGELKKNMPVETKSGVVNPPNARTTPLEA